MSLPSSEKGGGEEKDALYLSTLPLATYTVPLTYLASTAAAFTIYAVSIPSLYAVLIPSLHAVLISFTVVHFSTTRRTLVLLGSVARCAFDP